MKRIYLFLSILVCSLLANVANSQCTAVQTLSEDFSSYTVGSFFPMNCWEFVKDPSTISGSAYIHDDGDATSPNNVALLMGSVNSIGDRYFILPPLSTINGNYHLKFDARLMSALGTGSTLEVGTLDSNTSVANFAPVGTALSLTQTYQTFTIPVPATAGHQYVAIKLNPGGNISAILIDNIIWEPAPPVSVQSVNVTTENNASTTITTSNGTLQLEAEVIPSSANQDVTWSVQSGSAFASVDNTGLVTAIADGTAIIRATSDADTSIYGEITITIDTSSASPCSAVETFSEDFETFTTFPENCWTGNQPMAPTTTIIGTTNKRLQLYSGFATGDIIVVLPEVSTIDGQHELMFDIVSISQAGTTIQVGTMSDNTDFSTFSAVGSAFTPVAATKHITPAIPANPGHKYVAIKFIHGGGHKALQLDNIEWTSALSTPIFNTDKVTIYPNPGSGIFYLDTKIEVTSIELYNTLGQRVLKTNQKQINLENAVNGLYIVNINTADGTQVSYKIIKK